MKIAFDFVATYRGSGTKSYIVNFCNKINKISNKRKIYIFICKNYLSEIKDEMIFEIDALVSHLYGLNEKQLIHIFETFHKGWDYESRLKKVLKFFQEHKK